MIKLRQRDGGKAPEPMLSPMIDMIFLLLVVLQKLNLNLKSGKLMVQLLQQTQLVLLQPK